MGDKDLGNTHFRTSNFVYDADVTRRISGGEDIKHQRKLFKTYRLLSQVVGKGLWACIATEVKQTTKKKRRKLTEDTYHDN